MSITGLLAKEDQRCKPEDLDRTSQDILEIRRIQEKRRSMDFQALLLYNCAMISWEAFSMPPCMYIPVSRLINPSNGSLRNKYAVLYKPRGFSASKEYFLRCLLT